jgi:hypothetical protein
LHRSAKRALIASLMLAATNGAAVMLACGAKVDNPDGPLATLTLTTPAADPPAAPSSNATTCKELLIAHPSTNTGVYMMDLNGGVGDRYPPLALFCDMSFDGGGWTLIQSYTGGVESPASLAGASEDAGVLLRAPEPGKLGGLAGWIVQAIAAKSSQIHIRLSLLAAGGADGGAWITTKMPLAGETRAIANLRSLDVLTKGTDGGFDDWIGPRATSDKLRWSPFADGGGGSCAERVEREKYPSIYYACGSATSMNIAKTESLCRWTYQSSTNEAMEVYVR